MNREDTRKAHKVHMLKKVKQSEPWEKEVEGATTRQEGSKCK